MRALVLPPAARAEAGEAWVALEARVGEASPMCTWTWTGAWLEHYGDAVGHQFVLAEREGETCGIALVTEQAELSRLRPPTIALGTAGEPPGSSTYVERNRLLASDAERGAFAEVLMAELERRGGWQRLRFDGTLAEDARALLGQRRATLWQAEESPVADLSRLAEHEHLDWLPQRRRRRIERTLSMLGELECEWAGDASKARSMLDELIALHQARWQAKGQGGAFSSPRFTGFHRELVAQLTPRGRAALFRVRRDGETLACLYGLIEGERILFYQGGIVQHPDNRLRIGLAAHALFMRACQQRGLREYDFLAPAARYKSELSNRSEQLVWVEVERPGVRLTLERSARRARRALREARARATGGAEGSAAHEQAP